MDKRLDAWLETYGRRLAELKIAGGEEYFAQDENTDRLDNLTGNQWIEFFTLVGQLDGLIWALQPEDEIRAKQFRKAVAKRLDKIEKHCRLILKITGRINIPIGEA